MALLKKLNFYFAPEMLLRLKALSAKTGAPVSELVRRAVAAYLAIEQV